MSTLTGSQIKNTYQSLLKIGTNGSLDPTIPISITDGLGNNTPLLLSGIEFKTQVVSSSILYGYWADLSTNSHVAIGDYANQYNGTQLYLNDHASLIKTQYQGVDNGLKLDFLNNFYLLGNFNANGNYINVDEHHNFITLNTGVNSGNTTTLLIDDNNYLIKTSGQGNDKGLKLDFSNSYYQLGDFGGLLNFNYISVDDLNNNIKVQSQSSIGIGDYDANNNGTVLQISDVNRNITTFQGGQNKGLNLDFINSAYDLGDFNNDNNGTRMTIDDFNQNITFNLGNKLQFFGGALIDGATVVPVGKNLIVTINGDQYHIPLYN
jgi:hypothetical protein